MKYIRTKDGRIMKLLLYCTKAKPYLYENVECLKDVGNEYYTYNNNKYLEDKTLNGKIVAECDYEVEKLQIVYGKGWETKTIKGTENIEKLTCLSRDKLYQYCKGNGYAIHIKNLHIFDEPRFIQDYSKNENPYNYIENAPQNMMYAYDVKSFNNFEKKVLISIHPEWLCKILNGEKTIEVRKKVLKEMLKNE